jgi:peptidoglycan/LPS O-acetylase OafA/YrhL
MSNELQRGPAESTAVYESSATLSVLDTRARAASSQIKGIQVLRGAAAIMVVIHHFCHSVSEYHGAPSFLISSGIGELGGAGVDLFFVISGFIMVYTQRPHASGLHDALGFWRKRLIRIYPLYWLWTSVLLLLWCLGLALKSHHFSAPYVAASYLLWPYRADDGSTHPLLDQGWTLSFELYFYLFFGLAVALGRGKAPLRVLAPAFAVMALVGHSLPDSAGIRTLVSSPMISEFLLGVATAQLTTALKESAARGARWLGLAAILFSLVGFALSLFGAAPVPRVLSWGLPSALLVAGVVLRNTQHPLGGRLAAYLGDASYSIYLSHTFFTMLMGSLLKAHASLRVLPPDLTIVVSTLLTMAACAATYPAFEKPLLKLFSSSGQRPLYAARPSVR